MVASDRAESPDGLAWRLLILVAFCFPCDGLAQNDDRRASSYEEAFRDLHETLGREYAFFELKGIDWAAVGREMLPRASSIKDDDEFGLLCTELVARLEDSHAEVGAGSREPPAPPLPRYDPGFACLIDDHGFPVVYYVDKDGPAGKAGLTAGATVISIDGKPAEEALAETMRQVRKYVGYSSERYLRYHAAQWIARKMRKGEIVVAEVQATDGRKTTLKMPAEMDVRYLPRLPVEIPGIDDSASVAWTRLEDGIGYLRVRRIGEDLEACLDRAVGELKDVRGLVVDVRGNSGGGYDEKRAHRNFSLTDDAEPDRPRFRGPIALLLDPRCISAGEGWASWFVAQKRARAFGEATAGASARKTTYTLKNGLYTVRFAGKAYRGSLDRPIERRGVEPDVPLRQTVADLVARRDTVLEAARAHLLEQGK